MENAWSSEKSLDIQRIEQLCIPKDSVLERFYLFGEGSSRYPFLSLNRNSSADRCYVTIDSVFRPLTLVLPRDRDKLFCSLYLGIPSKLDWNDNKQDISVWPNLRVTDSTKNKLACCECTQELHHTKESRVGIFQERREYKHFISLLGYLIQRFLIVIRKPTFSYYTQPVKTSWYSYCYFI
jgi:hypothetical protein